MQLKRICMLFCITDDVMLSYKNDLLTLGLLRGLEDRPVDAPLTERDLSQTKQNSSTVNVSKVNTTFYRLRCYW